MRAREPEAWQRLLDLYSPLVYSWCRNAGIQAEDAADILQEVFKAVADSIAAFRRDRPGGTFRGWMRIIARNRIHDYFRRRLGQPTAVGGSDAHQWLLEIAEEESDTSLSLNAWGGLVRRALALIEPEFEERTWSAFWMAAVDGDSANEIAQKLGMTPGAVRQSKYKILRRLREELGDVE